MGPTHKELKKNNNKSKTSNRKDGRENFSTRENFDFFMFFSFQIFFLRFKENRPSEFVGINTESALRDEGYA